MSKFQSRRLRLVAAGVSLGAAMLAGPAYAQQSGDEPGTNTKATDTDRSDIIIVTAQRRSESVQDVPVTIQAFGAEQLQDLGVHNTQDLAQFTPNVNISSPFGPGSQPNIIIRGIGLNDFNSNNAGPNGVYVDEFYISSPNAQGNSLFDLERVEVLKGPQGTLYGRNTSGGAINFVTVKPSQEFTAVARVEHASFNTTNVDAAVGGALTDTLAGRISATYNHSDGFVDNLLLGRKENGSNGYALRGQLLWEPASDLTALLQVQTSHAEQRPVNYRLVGTLNPSPFDPVAVLLGAPDKCSAAVALAGQCVDLFGNGTPLDFYSGNFADRGKTRLEDSRAILRIDYSPGPITYTSITGFNYNSRFFPEESDATAQRILEIDYGAKSHEYTQELRASQEEERYNWVAGLYYLNELITQDQPLYVYRDLDLLFGAPGSADGIAQVFSTANRQSTESYAAFGQAEFEVSPGLNLVAGARYTSDKKSFFGSSSFRFQEGGMGNFGTTVGAFSVNKELEQDQFNWRLGANYDLSDDVMVFTSLSTGYKGGGFNGGFIVADAAVRDAALAPVKAETVTSFEAGLKSSLFDDMVTFNVAAFYNDYKDQQVLVQVIRDGVTVYSLDNAQKARTFGLDADVSIRPIEGLTLAGQLGLLDTELVEFVPSRDPSAPDYSGNNLTFAPGTTLALSADYEVPFAGGDVTFHYDANYRSKQYFDPSNTPYAMSPGYWLHNARISYAWEDGLYEVGAFARNIFEEEYIISGVDLTLTTGSIQQVYGAPRVVGVDFGVRY